jgi:hypothetical protein
MIGRLAILSVVVLAGCGMTGCGISASRYAELRAQAADQGRPNGPLATGVCSLENTTACSILCSRQIWKACNDAGVAMELSGGIGMRVSAASMYRLACQFGSEAGCFNRERLNDGRSDSEMMQAEAQRIQDQVAGITKAVDALAKAGSPESPNASGQVVVRGAGAPVTESLEICASGEPQGFFGVDLSNEAGDVVLRVAQDPIDGPRARLQRPGAEPARLEQASCSVLTATIEKTGTRNNNVTLLEGQVALDCKLADGTSVVAEARFSRCHQVAK